MIIKPFVAGLLVLNVGSILARASEESPPVWFGDIKGSISLQDSEAEKLLSFVAEAMNPGPGDNPSFPSTLPRLDGPRIVFLSVSNGNAPAKVFLGGGIGLAQSLESAIQRVRGENLPWKPRWIKLDLVQHVGRPENWTSAAKINPGLEGLALNRSSGIALLPEQLLHDGLIDKHGGLDRIRWQKVLQDSLPSGSKRPKTFRRFTTLSYFYDGQMAVRLYRGHRLTSGPSRKDLLDSVWLGGDYLCRALDENGQFTYLYYPDEDRVPQEYNLVRHAGAIYSLLDVYQTTQDPELLESAERAIGFMLKHVKTYKENLEIACIADGGKIGLGGVALAVVALAKHVEVTKNQQYLAIAQQLARYIQVSQGRNGKFINRRRYPSGRKWDMASDYYPGEAILALVRLHGVDGQQCWLDTAEKGARYLINVRDRKTPFLLQDHWLLYALNDLHRYRPQERFVNHSVKITRAIIKEQRRDLAIPDYVGGYFNPPGTCPAATRTEGLTAAYDLTRRAGRSGAANRILEALSLTVAFQLQTQFQPESALYCRDPQRACGGFHSSLTDHEIRIDYVQHNISGFICLYRLLDAERKDALADPASGSQRLLGLMRKRAFR